MHVCGFRDGDPDQLDIAQSSQTRGLAWSTLQYTISQLHTLSTMSLVMVKAPIHKWSRLEVFLSKAQLAEQSVSVSQTTSSRSPEIKRRTYICKTTRKDMHVHVALRALERCMDVVQLLYIRSGIVFEDSSLDAGTRP